MPHPLLLASALLRDDLLGSHTVEGQPRQRVRVALGKAAPADSATIGETLRAGGAREWQIELTLDLLTEAVATS